MFELDFITQQVVVLCRFSIPLINQPEFFQMNDDQSIAIISSQDDGIYYNFHTKETTDLDRLYQIKNIKEIIYDHED